MSESSLPPLQQGVKTGLLWLALLLTYLIGGTALIVHLIPVAVPKAVATLLLGILCLALAVFIKSWVRLPLILVSLAAFAFFGYWQSEPLLPTSWPDWVRFVVAGLCILFCLALIMFIVRLQTPKPKVASPTTTPSNGTLARHDTLSANFSAAAPKGGLVVDIGEVVDTQTRVAQVTAEAAAKTADAQQANALLEATKMNLFPDRIVGKVPKRLEQLLGLEDIPDEIQGDSNRGIEGFFYLEPPTDLDS